MCHAELVEAWHTCITLRRAQGDTPLIAFMIPIVMNVRLKTAVFLLACLPQLVWAEDTVVTRREGFLLLWDGIHRAVTEVMEEPFTDVPEGSGGFMAITFAKARGVIDGEGESFHPEEPLMLSDALLWLFRTRNVADLEVLRSDDVPLLIRRFPLLPESTDFSRLVSHEELLRLAQELDTILATEEHRVSLYAEDFHGDHTAFGEIFDMHAFTAAHKTLPQNTLLRVTNVENGKSVIVRVNDRGPYIPGRDLDLSLAAFTAIAPRSQGVIRATFERLGDSTVIGPCGLSERYQQRITREVRFHRGIPHVFVLGETLVLSANRPFVVRRVRYPDGTRERIEDWVLEKEKFSFRPAIVGTYIFRVGTPYGRSREMRMEVVRCGADVSW